jgi:iron(III) transport system ATP-binding protein
MLTVRSLSTEYPNGKGAVVKAAQDIAFEVPQGKLFTLLGPSGCGKTTTLRSIAGLERPVKGDIVVNDAVVYSSTRNIFVPPNRRDFGMVFQSYAIWPHMNVLENTAFPLRCRGRRLSNAAIEEKVMRVLKAVALDHLATRDATKLSGGQQQRLALARALVMEPRLLLLDEPLSNLDAKLRELMRFELKRIQRELNLTTIYVTHDQSEALALSHQIAVLRDGRIEQLGTPREIYERPKTKFVADFVGTTNFIEGRVLDRMPSAGEWLVDSEIGKIRVATDEPLQPGDALTVSIRPENVHLSDAAEEDPTEGVRLVGTVDSKVFLGEVVDYKVTVGDGTLLVRAHPTFRKPVGSRLSVLLPTESCTLIKA